MELSDPRQMTDADLIVAVTEIFDDLYSSDQFSRTHMRESLELLRPYVDELEYRFVVKPQLSTTRSTVEVTR